MLKLVTFLLHQTRYHHMLLFSGFKGTVLQHQWLNGDVTMNNDATCTHNQLKLL